MEILKKLHKSLAVALLLILSNSISAQENGQMQEAFTQSYTWELGKNFNKAIDALKASYDPVSYEYNVRLGWLSYFAGQYSESEAYYQKAIALKPFALEPRFGVIMPATAEGNFKMAEDQYKKILEIDPMNTIANYRLGQLYFGKEDFENAKIHFEKVVNLYPFDYDSVIAFARTQYKLGNLREAKVLFSKALLIRPGDQSASDGLQMIK